MDKTRAGRALVAATVSLSLLLGALGSATGLSLWQTDIDETRALAPLPDASPGDFGRFVQQWDAYMGDHFGHRPALIKAYALFRHRVLNAYSAENAVLDWLQIEQ